MYLIVTGIREPQAPYLRRRAIALSSDSASRVRGERAKNGAVSYDSLGDLFELASSPGIAKTHG